MLPHQAKVGFATVVLAGLLASAAPPVPPAEPGRNLIAVRFWTLNQTTRVAIETSASFEYKSDRVPNPDRIFFDLPDTGVRLNPGRKRHAAIPVGDARLKQIRVAETQPGVTRVVFDIEPGVDFTASRLANPPRLIVELRAATGLSLSKSAPPPPKVAPSPAATTAALELPAVVPPPPEQVFVPADASAPPPGRGTPPASAKPAASSTKKDSPQVSTARTARTDNPAVVPPPPEQVFVPAEASAPPPGKGTPLASAKPAASSTKKDSPQVSTARTARTDNPAVVPPPPEQVFVPAEASAPPPGKGTPLAPAKPAASSAKKDSPQVATARTARTDNPAVVPPPPEQVFVPAEASASGGGKNGSLQVVPPPPEQALVPDEVAVAAPPSTKGTTLASTKPIPAGAKKGAPPVPPAPRAAKTDRSQSMTRVLGLKVGRIVIDAGHGGHDTGTIGPNGLYEKDVVLDVAKRVGALIEAKMGAEVIYTRSDDTFIPLERRPQIANEERADLFLSIHANSSPVSTSSGVETYYLNFTDNKAVLETAARENAGSQRTVADLKDLIRKIAMQEKIEESRQFAARVQASLYSTSLKANVRTKDRGVRKAPFVVLIGAEMPAILAEIGFVTNPKDESLFRKSDYRQKIADGLFQGLSRYAATLSQFQVAQK